MNIVFVIAVLNMHIVLFLCYQLENSVEITKYFCIFLKRKFSKLNLIYFNCYNKCTVFLCRYDLKNEKTNKTKTDTIWTFFYYYLNPFSVKKIYISIYNNKNSGFSSGIAEAYIIGTITTTYMKIISQIKQTSLGETKTLFDTCFSTVKKYAIHTQKIFMLHNFFKNQKL